MWQNYSFFFIYPKNGSIFCINDKFFVILHAEMNLLMKRICLLTIATLISFSAFAGRPQTRTFTFDTICSASMNQINEVIDRFAYQFQTDPDTLFSWVFSDTGSVGGEEDATCNGQKIDSKGKDAIFLDYKPGTYDPVKRTGDVLIDIYILGVLWYRDTHLGTIFTREQRNDSQFSHVDATYSGSLLDKGSINFYLTPLRDNKVQLTFTISLTFGRFFSYFISDKTWNEVASWRMAKVARNFVYYFENGVPEQ